MRFVLLDDAKDVGVLLGVQKALVLDEVGGFFPRALVLVVRRVGFACCLLWLFVLLLFGFGEVLGLLLDPDLHGFGLLVDCQREARVRLPRRVVVDDEALDEWLHVVRHHYKIYDSFGPRRTS